MLFVYFLIILPALEGKDTLSASQLLKWYSLPNPVFGNLGDQLTVLNSHFERTFEVVYLEIKLHIFRFLEVNKLSPFLFTLQLFTESI